MDSTGESFPHFEQGQIVADRYEVVRTLGAGAVGMVVQVVDRTLDNDVLALKILYPQMARDQTQFGRFRHEVVITRTLGHPNIVRLYDFGSAGRGYYFLTMEYVEGGSLGQRLYGMRAEKPSFSQIIKYLYQLCLGLSCAHQQGIVHRDLKPDNILLTNQDEVKITDFGLARSLEVSKGFTNTGETVGTPYYMAPEQIQGLRPSPSMDIYSLGIIAFELAVGRRPFLDESYMNLAHMHLGQPLPDMATQENGIPAWFEEFTKRCAAKAPKDRYQSVDEMAFELYSHLDDDANALVRRGLIAHSFYYEKEMQKPKPQGINWGSLGFKSLVAVAVAMAVVLFFTFKEELVNSKKREQFLVAWSNTQPSDFFSAVLSNDAEQVSAILERAGGGSDENLLSANSKDGQGTPVLTLAVKRGHRRVVETLLAFGADLESADTQEKARTGKTLLMQAARLGHADILPLLLRKQSNIGERDSKNMTALMHAIDNNRITAAEALLSASRIEIQKSDEFGTTPLMFAIKSENEEMVQMVLSYQPSLNDQDSRGLTALMYAVQLDNETMTQELLRRGADSKRKTKSGKSVRSFATRSMKHLLAEHERKTPLYTGASNTQTTEPTSKARAERTTLRMKTRPTVTFTENGGNPRHEISITVMNYGEVDAQDVQVEVALPDGRRVQLQGPATLARKQQKTYTTGRLSDLPRDLKIPARDISLSCSNCRSL